MKAKTIIYLLCSSLVLFFLSGMFTTFVYAEGENGGAVQTNGVIGFVEDDPTDEPTIDSSSDSTTTTPSTSRSTGTKAKGKYPSTGELVRKSLSITGIFLILIVVFWFFYKQKKKGAEE